MLPGGSRTLVEFELEPAICDIEGSEIKSHEQELIIKTKNNAFKI